MIDLPPSGTLTRLADALREWTGLARWQLRLRGTTIETGVVVKSPSRLATGRGGTLQRGTIVHCGGKAWSDYAGHVVLGSDVVLGPYCILYGAGGIVVGDSVHFGPGAKVLTQSGLHGPERLGAHPRHRLLPVAIGAGSWIGAGAVVLGGSTLGRCVTVAPNSVVSGTIPDFAIAAGNPARVVGYNETLE